MTVTPNSTISVQSPRLGLGSIANADASNLKTVFAAGANGAKITSLTLSNSDTSPRDVTWGVSRAGTFYPWGSVTVPLSAGQAAGVPSVNAFSPAVAPGLPIDSDGQPYLLMQSGDTLDFKALTTVTAAKNVMGLATAGDF